MAPELERCPKWWLLHFLATVLRSAAMFCSVSRLYSTHSLCSPAQLCPAAMVCVQGGWGRPAVQRRSGAGPCGVIGGAQAHAGGGVQLRGGVGGAQTRTPRPPLRPCAAVSSKAVPLLLSVKRMLKLQSSGRCSDARAPRLQLWPRATVSGSQCYPGIRPVQHVHLFCRLLWRASAPLVLFRICVLSPISRCAVVTKMNRTVTCRRLHQATSWLKQ